MSSGTHPLSSGVNGVTRGLVAQFLVGVALATFGEFDPDAASQSISHNIFFGLHVLIALSLVVGALILWFQARSLGVASLKGRASAGLASVVLALVGGVMIMGSSDFEHLSIFVMSVGFILALLIYGYWAVELSLAGKKS
ncbi:MAG: hypothetical protein WCO52_00275 [bacterium]